MTTKPFQRATDIITQSASKSLPSPGGLRRIKIVFPVCWLQAFSSPLSDMAHAAGEHTVASIEFLLPAKRWNAREGSSELGARLGVCVDIGFIQQPFSSLYVFDDANADCAHRQQITRQSRLFCTFRPLSACTHRAPRLYGAGGGGSEIVCSRKLMQTSKRRSYMNFRLYIEPAP